MKNVLVLATLALVLSSCFEKKEDTASQANSVTTEAAAPAEAAPADAAAPAEAAPADAAAPAADAAHESH